MEQIVQIDDVKTFNDLYGLETTNPLVSVIDVTTNGVHEADTTRFNYGVYALFIKHGKGCTMRYGRQTYDYQEGTVVCLAPGQVVDVTKTNNVGPMKMEALIFHPDLIYGTSLADKMGNYTFFNYSENEALHMAKEEQHTLRCLLSNIKTEMAHDVDSHSRELLCSYVELFLNYCMRFYDRQFHTRAKVNNGILHKFEDELHSYFANGSARRQGLPSVKYFADKVFLSANYFGDLIKRETGKSPQDYIHLHTIAEAKHYLLGTDMGIAEIADTLGFQYPQHFSRMFKKHTGYTPNEFRKIV